MSKTALLFAGQGAQCVGMGQDLAGQFPSARHWFDQANDALGYDLAQICFTGPKETLTQTEHAQPAILLVGWIAYQLLKEEMPSFSVHATAGLSLGEFTALAAAQALTFQDAIRVVRQRGQFMQEACDQTQGGMAAIIGLDFSTTQSICQESGVEIANLNCPGQIVISGPTEALSSACNLAKTKGAKRALPLTVAGAYHSTLMKAAQAKLQVALADVPIHPPSVPVISNVSAAAHGGPEDIRCRLVEQVTSPVRWEDSIRGLLANGFTQFIELGPGTALTGFLRRIEKSANILNIGDLPSLKKTIEAIQTGA